MDSWESICDDRDESGSYGCNSFAKDDDRGGSSSDVQQPRFRSYACNRFSCNSKLSHALATSTMALIMAACLLLPLACNADVTPDTLPAPAAQEENNDIIANIDEKSAVSETPSFLESSLGGGGLEENIRSEVKNEIKTVQVASPSILNALNELSENEKIVLIEYPKAASSADAAESDLQQRNDSKIEALSPVEVQCDANSLVCQWNKNKTPTTTPTSIVEHVEIGTPEPPAETTIPPVVAEVTPTPELAVPNVPPEQPTNEENILDSHSIENVNQSQNETSSAAAAVQTEAQNSEAETITLNSPLEATLLVSSEATPTSNAPTIQTSSVETITPKSVPEAVLSLDSLDEVEPQAQEETATSVAVQSLLGSHQATVAPVDVNELSFQAHNVEELLPQAAVVLNAIQDTNIPLVVNESDAFDKLSQPNDSANGLTETSSPSNPPDNPLSPNSVQNISVTTTNTVNQISINTPSVAPNEPSNALQDSSMSEETSSNDLESNSSADNDIAILSPPSNSNEISQSEESNEDLPAPTTPSSVQLIPSSNINIENDTLSISFEEPLGVTEQPVLLEDDFDGTDFRGLETTHTTLPPKESMHNIIKKQGVESIDIDSEPITETTTTPPATNSLNEELTEEPIVLAEGNEERLKPLDTVEISPTTLRSTISTAEPIINEQTTQSTPTTRIANDIVDLAVVFSGKGDEDATTTSKGSRSINSLSADFNGHQKASINFDIYPAGQTINGNLAEEAPNGIGKALQTHHLGEEPSNRSALIIALCSGTAILFVVVSVAFFLISFQRQHGTLDIEMQEQRCGKDNVNEEVAESCVKLLDVDLPTSGLASQTDAEAEIEECL